MAGAVRAFDNRYPLLVVAFGGIARAITDGNATTTPLERLIERDERLVVATAAATFGEFLGEATILVLALAAVAFAAYVAPRIVDFFFASCRMPRHMRYMLVMGVRALVVIIGIYYAFVLVNIDLTTIVVVASVATLIAADLVRPLVSGFVAGFCLQSGTKFEPGRRIRVGPYYGTIVALGTFTVTLRLMPSSSAAVEARTSTTSSASQADAAATTAKGRRVSSDEPDEGRDDYGIAYADKLVDIPNVDLLNQAVVTYWATPQANAASPNEHRYAQPVAAWLSAAPTRVRPL